MVIRVDVRVVGSDTVFDGVLREVEPRGAHLVECQMIGPTRLLVPNRRDTEIPHQRENLLEYRSRGRVALVVEASDPACAVIHATGSTPCGLVVAVECIFTWY